MLNTLLTHRLIDKGVISQGTAFLAYYDAPGLSCTTDARITGNFIVHSVKLLATTKQIILEGCGADKIMRRFRTEDVITVDGMAASRLARVYGLLEDGTDAQTGKRRGRRGAYG